VDFVRLHRTGRNAESRSAQVTLTSLIGRARAATVVMAGVFASHMLVSQTSAKSCLSSAALSLTKSNR